MVFTVAFLDISEKWVATKPSKVMIFLVAKAMVLGQTKLCDNTQIVYSVVLCELFVQG